MNRKAPGPDNITVEAMIANMETVTKILHSLFEKI